jgi:hypothetical protein
VFWGYLHAVIIDQIKQRLGNGFHPFTLHMTDGQKFAVPHRDFIAFTPRVVVVIDDRDVSHTLSPLHIVSIEDSAPTN